MYATTTSAAPGACPTCSAYTMAHPTGHGEYCPGCLTVVKRVRGVKIVQPGAFRTGSLR